MSSREEQSSSTRSFEERVTYLASWRERIAALALASTGTLLVVGSSVVIGIEGLGPLRALALSSLTAGLGLLGLARWSNRSRFHMRALFGALALLLVSICATVGWAPGFVGAAALFVALAGLLGDRPAVLAASAYVVVVMVVTGSLAGAGVLHIDQALMGPRDVEHWVRTGIVVVLFEVTLVFIFRSALSTIDATLAQSTASLQAARDEATRLAELRSERRAAEQELERAQKLQAVGQVTNGLSHHLNNLLTAMRGELDAIRRTPNNPAAVQPAAAAIARLSERGAELLRSMMVFGRVETTEAPQRSNLREVVATFHDSLQGVVRDDVELSIELADLEVGVRADHIQQVVLNLVLNAVDAMPEGGRLDIAAHRADIETAPAGSTNDIAPGHYVVLQVTDTGPGMAAETLAQAADPFFTTKADDGSPGLGLFVAVGIARRAGGGLSLESNQHGTIASLWLPDAAVDQNPGTVAVAPIDGPAPAPVLPVPSRQPASPTPGDERGSDDPSADPAQQDAVVLPTGLDDGADLGEVLDDWRVVLVRRLLRIVAAAHLASLASIGISVILESHSRGISLQQTAALAGSLLTSSMISTAAAALIAGIGGWGLSQHPNTRAALLLFSLSCSAVPAVVWGTYLSGGLPVLFLITVLAITLRAPLSAWFAPGLTVVAFFAGGLLHSRGDIVAPMEFLDMSVAANWYRQSVPMAIVLAVLVASVHGLGSRARVGLAQLVRDVRRWEELRRTRVTELAALERLQELNSMTARAEVAGSLLGTVVHDLNNTLQTTLMWSSFLDKASTPDEPTVIQAVHGIDEGLELASALVGQFQLEHTASSGRANLGEVVSRTMKLLQRRAPQGVAIDVEVEDAGPINVDGRAVQRVVLNLVENAIQAVDNEGHVRVRVDSTSNGRAELVVTDDGCGMDEATLGSIFNPFFTARRDGTGTGLGLVAVQNIVDATGGAISVQSDVGNGTTFRVSWPGGLAGETTVPVTEGVRVRKLRGKVLIADDNVDVLGVLVRTLEFTGLDVLSATNGDDAVQKVQSTADLDVLVIDGVMPGAPTSVAVEAFVATHPPGAVLVCSGYPTSYLRERGLRVDGIRFLLKPFRPDALLEAVRVALEEARATTGTTNSVG